MASLSLLRAETDRLLTGSFDTPPSPFALPAEINGLTGNVTIVPSAGGPPLRILKTPGSEAVHGPRWTPDGNALIYVPHKGLDTDLWIQRLDGTSPQRLTNFASDDTHVIWNFVWSKDGSQIVMSRGQIELEIAVVKNVW